VTQRIIRVARIHDPACLGASGIIDKSLLRVDLVISPEAEVAQAAVALARVPGAADVLDFAGGRVRAVGAMLDEDSPMIGRPGRFFRDAEWRFYAGVLVCSILVIAAVV